MTVIFISTPNDIINLISTPNVDLYCCFYPGCWPLLLLLYRVLMIINIFTPRVDIYCFFYSGCRRLLLILYRMSTIIIIFIPGVNNYYCFYTVCWQLLLFLYRVSTVKAYRSWTYSPLHPVIQSSPVRFLHPVQYCTPSSVRFLRFRQTNLRDMWLADGTRMRSDWLLGPTWTLIGYCTS